MLHAKNYQASVLGSYSKKVARFETR